MSDKTSSVLGPVRHATALRLTRIGTLVVGSLVFLYACEVSRKSDLSDVWLHVAFAGGLAVTGLTTAWFEIKAADHAATRARTDIRGFRIESDSISVRARITRSGDLVFHGHDTGGTYPAYEWDWAFRATTFPAIRFALGGGKGDLLDLLERTVPDLDRKERYDPGAWLHHHGIPAAFRERGDTSHRITRELPVVEPEGPHRESTGAQKLSSKRHNPIDPPHPSRSSRREPPGQDTPAPTRSRASDSPDPRKSPNRYDEPTRRRDQPSNTRRRASDRLEAESDAYADRTPADRRAVPPQDRWDAPSGDRWDAPPSDHWDAPPSDHRDTPPSDHRGTAPSNHWDTPPNDEQDDALSDSWNAVPSNQWDSPPARSTRPSEATRYEPDSRIGPPAASRGASPIRRRDQPPFEPSAPTNARRAGRVDSPRSEPSGEGSDEPSASRGTPPDRRRAESPRDELGAPTRSRRETPADPRRSEPSSDRWNEPPVNRHREQVDYRQPTGRPGDESSGAHRHVLSGAHPSESPRRPREPQGRRDKSPDRRHRRS
ncbi:hypothetical protein ACQPXH_10245 [Nocardia sp. CA-135953]|uniref:hypothetical protein n=1 Tax=Nocardia sp. CA-135953 TaxID=3239978 RepID=UPI003D983DC7